MFANFKNKDDMNHKYQELIDRVNRRNKQRDEKREMYAEAMWANDNPTIKTKLSSDSSNGIQPDDIEGEIKKAVENVMYARQKNGVNSDLGNIHATSDERKPRLESISLDMATPEPQPETPSSVSVDSSKSNIGSIGNRSESDLQDDAKQLVIDWYKQHPDWEVLKINPIMKDGRTSKSIYLGKSAKLMSSKTGKSTNSKYVDWVKTEDKVSGMYYDEQSNSVDELSQMRLEEKRSRLLTQKLGKRKATDEVDHELSHLDKSQQYEYPETKEMDTQTSDDQFESYELLKELLREYKDVLPKNFILYPTLYDGFKFNIGKSAKSYSIRFNQDGTNLMVVDNITKASKPTIKDAVDWNDTLTKFIQQFTNSEGYPTLKANKEMKSFWKDLQPPVDGVQTGMDIRDLPRNQSMSQIEAKELIKDYIKRLTEYGLELPFTLHPTMNGAKKIGVDRKKKFGTPEGSSYINIYQESYNKQKKRWEWHKLSPTKNLEIQKSVNWYATFEDLVGGIDNLRETLMNSDSMGLDGETQSQIRLIITTFEKLLKENGELGVAFAKPYQNADETGLLKRIDISEAEDNVQKAKYMLKQAEALFALKKSKRSEAAVVSAKENLRAQQKLYNIVSKHYEGKGLNSHLKGKGLKGAGKGVYQHVERRTKYYNLNDIQGTGIASAYIYQQLGSKFIRIPDLDKNVLNIVYPCRRRLGCKREISNPVKHMLKELIYDGKLSQSQYDKLSIEDKRLIKEILKHTHIQNAFKDELSDPLKQLTSEYEKLKGEIMLGNNNPSILTQLKPVLIDMYANQLISTKEFKDTLNHLI